MASSLENNEIVNIYLENGLIKTCVECNFAKLGDHTYEEDFFQDLVLILLEYDNNKMNNAHSNNHMNALLTRIIRNNIFSKTSPYYKMYKKQTDREDEITKETLNIADEDED